MSFGRIKSILKGIRPRKFLISLLVIVVLCLLSLAIAAGLLLGTEKGRLWLLDTALDKGLGAGPVQVITAGVQTPALGEWRFERITVTRNQETWLDLHRFSLRWQPGALLSKHILVNSLRAETVALDPSAGAPTPEPTDQTSSTFTLPDISLTLEKVELERFHLLENPQQVPDLQLEADLRFSPRLPLLANLQVNSLPGSPATPDASNSLDPYANSPLALSVRSHTADGQLLLQAELQEDPGGWLGQQLQLPAGSGIDANLRATVDDHPRGYWIDIEKFKFPFLNHTLGLTGILLADTGLQLLDIEQLQLTTDERQHQIAGNVSADALDLTLDIDQFPLDLLSPWVPQITDGTLSAGVSVEGSPQSPEVAGRLSADSHISSLAPAKPDGAATQRLAVALDLSGEFSREQLVFEQLTAQLGETRAELSGRVDLVGSTTDMTFALDSLPLAYAEFAGVQPTDFGVPSWLDLRIVEAQGRVQGDYRNPEIELEAAADGSLSQADSQQNFTVALKARGNRQRVTLGNAEIHAGEASITASGLVDTEGTGTNLTVALNSAPTALLELAIDLPAQLTAQIDGQATVTGALTAPEVAASLTSVGQFEGQAFDVRIDGTGNRNVVHLSQAQARVGSASLNAQGTFDIVGEQTDLTLSLDQAPLSLLELAGIQPPPGLTAEISGSASLSGSLPLPEATSQLQMTGTYDDMPLVLTANGSLVERRVLIDKVELKLDGATAVEVTGFLQPDIYDLRLSIKDLPQKTISGLGWDLMTGDFNGDLHISGTPTDPKIDGTFNYDGSLKGLNPETGEETLFELGWNTRITTVKQILAVESEFTRNQRETGALHLTLPISSYLTHIESGGSTSALPLAFDLNGALDLAILSLVLDPDIHRLSGRAAVRLQGEGSVAQPILTGALELLDSRYENTLSGTLFSDVQLLLQSQGTRVTIADARAQGSGRGHLEASGVIDWSQPDSESAINIQLKAQHAALLEREDLDGEVTGELALTGSFNELWLEGELDVTPFAANIEVALQTDIPEIQVVEVYGDRDEPLDDEGASSIIPTINLDLTIKADQQAYLRGRGLEAELAGQIFLSGTAASPHFDGDFSIVRGVFEVFGRKFTLLQGEVIFANNALYMYIPGEYVQDEHTIRAELSGTVENLELKLTSVPDLPEDEILSRLIFGKSAQNITPFEAIRLAGAIQTLRGGGGFDPVGSTRDALGVDTLSIESSTTDSGSGVSVGVGKYLSERVYLEVKRTPNEIQPWQGSIEIQLSPRLHLKSTTGGDSRTGAELLWKRDF